MKTVRGCIKQQRSWHRFKTHLTWTSIKASSNLRLFVVSFRLF